MAPGSTPSASLVRFRTALFERFPALRSGGIFNCRPIAGTSLWSDHARAHAEDYFPTTKAYGDMVVLWIRTNAEKYCVRQVLWQIEDHYFHFHVGMEPKPPTGLPECAGGARWVPPDPCKPSEEPPMPPPPPPQPFTADEYYERLAKSGVTPADFAGTVAYLTGFRIARRNLALPERFLNQKDAVQGHTDGKELVT